VTTFPRDEVEAAFRRQRELNDSQDWERYVDLFTDDAVYVEHEMGTFRGKQEIRDWLVPTMAPLVDAGWDYPLDWYTIDGNRVIFRWLNRLPNVDGRTEPYQFAGITVLEYAGDGKFSLQEDIYNMKECEAVMVEWFKAGGSIPAPST
jgi:ketosteroid isomerase-like protein